MTLNEFATRKGLTQAQLARLIGASRANVCNWLNGTTPTAPMLAKIERATKGQVKMADFLQGDTPQ